MVFLKHPIENIDERPYISSVNSGQAGGLYCVLSGMGGVAELTYMAEARDAGIIPGARHSYPQCGSEVSRMLLRSLEAIVLHGEQFGVH